MALAAALATAACSASPAPVPTPTPSAAPAIFGPLAAGGRVLAYDWSGKAAPLPPLPAGYVTAQSQDGRYLAIGDGVYSVDTGQRAARWPQKGTAVFASTGPATCGVRDDSAATINTLNAVEYLWVGNRKLTPVGTNGRFGRPELLACSTDDGFALVQQLGNIETTVAVYQLADGRRQWQLPGAAQAVASPSGRLLAVALPGPVLAIFALPGGRRVGTLQIAGSPVGFSGDGARIAVTVPTQPRFQSYVVDWTRQTTLWTHPDSVALLRSEPRGAGMILMTPAAGNGPRELWLVPRGGDAVRLAG